MSSRSTEGTVSCSMVSPSSRVPSSPTAVGQRQVVARHLERVLDLVLGEVRLLRQLRGGGRALQLVGQLVARALPTLETWPESFWGSRKIRCCSDSAWKIACRTHHTA